MLLPRSAAMQAAFETLNPQQQLAASHKDGPLVVFAGAGSGKTRVITQRVALLLDNFVPASKILAVTFTNKAAKEMKERIERLTSRAGFVTIGTFHAVCARWLREFGEKLGFTPQFVIYDEADAISLLKKIFKDLGMDKESKTPKDYKYSISAAKNLGLLPDDLLRRIDLCERLFPHGSIEVYKAYQKALKDADAMDFDDLLLHMVQLLKKDQEVLDILGSRYQYVMVDEYQDTNKTQFALITSLVSRHQNLFVVGDDDQSIYSWRGADPSNILNFSKMFSTAKEIRLEQNYRCSRHIVDAASALIANNQHRADKKLWTDNPSGSLIQVVKEHDHESEAWFIATEVKSSLMRFDKNQIAVFYRTNAQSRVFEDTFRFYQIPYQIFGALRFYDRAEVKDIVAYLRLIHNHQDEVALRRILNVPTRGLSDKTFDLIEQITQKTGVCSFQALIQISQLGIARISGKVKEFIDMIFYFSSLIEKTLPSVLVQQLIEKIDYSSYAQKKYPEQHLDKMENVYEIAAALSAYEEKNPQATISSWLADISLLGSEEDTKDGVSLMTLHAAKGLEFEKVFIAGFEDGLIPHSNSLDDPITLEEERRLMYVGITRAKQELTFSYARKRLIYNHWTSNIPSRFLKEIPKTHLS